MFDTVLGHSHAPRRVGAGALLSIGVHAALISAGIWISARAVLPASGEKKVAPILVFAGSKAGARAGSPASAPAKSRATHRSAPRHALLPPTPVAEPAPATAPSAADAAPVTGVPVDADGEPGGPGGGCTGADCADDGPGDGPGTGPGGGEVVMDAWPGMQAPVLLSSVPIQLTPEAMAARVQGTLLVRCTLTETGAVQDCHALKTLPFMEETVVRSLEQRRYSPVMFQGRPVSVRYVFTVRIVQP